eukprot:TRINITY_DN15100_c0_g1_i1.p1 TRINITY_DN15100_c0_g1~~TRINITY_DN15100_c0_g1_i1.p1  ORF type:complete len:302 (-),score=64.87 TRINITY_DN15100_c0_g1_i1:169-1074(-)
MSYSAWKAANSAQNLVGKNVLVIGGTQGIGAGIATRFSQIGASVYIAGRNEAAANQLLEELQKNRIGDQSEFKFFRVDASSIQDMDRFTKEVKNYFESRGGLHYLVQTQGILNSPFHSRTTTNEGHDLHFMTNAYSKWFLTDRLLPLLKNSCIYVFAPSKSGQLNFEDLELLKGSKVGGPTTRDLTFTDAITLEFQKRYPEKRFYHLFPGVVNTDLAKNSGFSSFLNGMAKGLANLVGRSPVQFADFPVYVALNPSEMKASRYTEKAKVVPDYDWIKSDDHRGRLFEWCRQAAEAQMNKEN